MSKVKYFSKPNDKLAASFGAPRSGYQSRKTTCITPKFHKALNFVVFLAGIEDFFHNDRLFARHTMYYVREMRIIAYTQLLESYRSLTLQYMADAFGVSVVFIDR